MEHNEIKKGALYIVATPIGNLSDISERALKVLSGVDFIAAEDTRVSAKLLLKFNIKKSVITYFEHNKFESGEKIVSRLISGESCALITDAGTPAISDPGTELVRLCKEKGLAVIPVPGACAAISALCASGFDSRRFIFEGFLPTDSEKDEIVSSYINEKRTVIFYEAPHRLVKTLKLLFDILGDRDICLARELTKLNEEIVVTTLEKALTEYEVREPKGEYVIIVGGRDSGEEVFWEKLSVKENVEFYTKQGLSKMDAMKSAAKDRGISKSTIYKEML